MEPEKNEILITVAGNAGVGKTTVAMLVQAALAQCDIEATAYDTALQTEDMADATKVADMIEAVSKKTKVRIEVKPLYCQSL